MSDIKREKEKGVERAGSFRWVRIRICILQVEKHGNKILVYTPHLVGSAEMPPGRLKAQRMPVVSKYLLFGPELRNSSKPLFRNLSKELALVKK